MALKYPFKIILNSITVILVMCFTVNILFVKWLKTREGGGEGGEERERDLGKNKPTILK